MPKVSYNRNSYFPDILGDASLSDLVGNSSTVENIDNINESNVGVSKYYQRYGSVRWSPNNPYGNQIPYSYSADQAYDLFTKAVEWESNYGDTLLARRFQLQDRDHDEQYNSPASQVFRERVAGRNPDIQDALTIASDSGNAPVSSPVSNDAPTSVDNSNADATTAQTVIGGSATLANAVLSCLNFAQGLPIANQQLQSLQLSNAHQSMVNADFGKQSFLQSVPVASIFADSALALAGDNNFTFDHVTQALAGSPYQNDDDFGQFVYNLAQSPEMKSRLLSSLDSYDEASSMRSIKGQMNFAEEFAKSRTQLMLRQNDLELAIKQNELVYQNALAELDFPRSQAMTEVSENDLTYANNRAQIDNGLPEDNAVTQKSRNQMIRKQVEDSLRVYDRAIGEVCKQIQDMDASIAKLEQKGYLTPTERTTLSAMRIARQQAYVYGSEQWAKCQISYRNFCYDALRLSVGTMPSIDGRNTPNWLERTLFGKKKDVDFLNSTFDKRLEYGDDFDMAAKFMSIFPIIP